MCIKKKHINLHPTTANGEVGTIVWFVGVGTLPHPARPDVSLQRQEFDFTTMTHVNKSAGCEGDSQYQKRILVTGGAGFMYVLSDVCLNARLMPLQHMSARVCLEIKPISSTGHSSLLILFVPSGT